MKKVLILGAGMVVKPMTEYFLDTCKFRLVLADRYISRARKIIGDRPHGKAVLWKSTRTEQLNRMVNEADLVVSMLPPQFHTLVAQACIQNKTSLVTTSYITPEMERLDRQAKSLDLIFLNEIGEDPGLDHMDAKRRIDLIHAGGGQVVSLKSYGAGLPHPETPSNPLGYKFSWSPRGVFRAGSQPAAFLQKGIPISVPAEDLFKNPRRIRIGHIGTFETYPNRDCRVYIRSYGLAKNITLFRGLLRYPGWCDTMQNLKNLNLHDDQKKNRYKNKTYHEFMADLVNMLTSESISKTAKVPDRIARYLRIKNSHDFIKKAEWLGLFSDQKIPLLSGTNLDLLLDLMLKKMSYGPDDKDITIVHNEIISFRKSLYKKYSSTLLLAGIPYQNSAMATAVSLPAAIASRHIMQNRIKVKGVQLPVHKEIYQPVLDELEELRIVFKQREDKVKNFC